MHGPVSAGDCTACHAPHESDIKPLLRQEGGRAVRGLSRRRAGAAEEDPTCIPRLQGGCTSCHNPHGSEHPKLLADEGAGVCFACHDEIGTKVAKAPVVHAAVKDEKGCASCHSPARERQREAAARVPRRTPALAATRRSSRQSMTTLHGPIQRREVHALPRPARRPEREAPRGRIPDGTRTSRTPTRSTRSVSPATSAICVQYPDTSFATGFRDGERNLHYLHVNNKQKGRSCRMCHDMHGSRSPKLIAAAVPFGKWSLPLKFVKTETGGSCAPGCHKPAGLRPEDPGPEAGGGEALGIGPWDSGVRGVVVRHAVTHERAASRERPGVDEDGERLPGRRRDDADVEVDEVGVRAGPRRAALVHAVRIVAGGAGGARREVPAVAAAGGRAAAASSSGSCRRAGCSTARGTGSRARSCRSSPACCPRSRSAPSGSAGRRSRAVPASLPRRRRGTTVQ